MHRASCEGYIVLKPDSYGLYAARQRIRGVTEELRLPKDQADSLLIAVGEAVSNAYRHGAPNPTIDLIRLSWRHDVSGLVVTIKDDGNGFGKNPRFCPSDRPGSLARGLELMRACVDEVRFISDRGGTVVLRKRIKLLRQP